MAPPTKKLIRIPLEGEVNPDDLSNRSGRKTFCEKCDQELTGSLKLHYINIHVKGHTPSAKTYELDRIPPGYKGPAERIYADPGYCGICDKEVKRSLRNHYRSVHLKETEQCPVCEKNINFGGMVSHMLTHSGPVRCSKEGCGTICESRRGFQSHKSRNHRGEKDVTHILLNDAEREEWETAKRASQYRTAMRDIDRPRILEMAKKLKAYEIALANVNDPVYRRARRLEEEFDTFFDFPSTAMKVVNASFVTIWQPNWRIPVLVFERIDRATAPTNQIGTGFFNDPKVADEHQPLKTDYPGTGYHRTHLASASNYCDINDILPTYYFLNIIPQFNATNTFARAGLEKFLCDSADRIGFVWAAHFPLMGTEAPVTIGSGVRVPPAVGTVMIANLANGGRQITAWRLHNQIDGYDFDQTHRDPFNLFAQAQVPFRLTREDFTPGRISFDST